MAVSACGEGCHKEMELLLPNIMEGILPYLKDEVGLIEDHIAVNNCCRIRNVPENLTLANICELVALKIQNSC